MERRSGPGAADLGPGAKLAAAAMTAGSRVHAQRRHRRVTRHGVQRCAAATVLTLLSYAATAAPSPVTAIAPYPACPRGLQCAQLSPKDLPGMTFDCARAGPPPGSELGNVYLMHGDDGMYSKGMWAETMLQLAGKGYNTLACDQRGYSPGAAPDDPGAYNYDLLASDILAIVSAAGFDASFSGKFHVVAHDQGARVVWHSIAKGMTRHRLLSFSSLSIPHADVFSSNLCCDAASTHQEDQTAAQYLRQLTLNSSVTVNHDTLFRDFCGSFGFNTTLACQKSFWWYNGGIDAGAMAMAPLMPFGHSIASKVNISYTTVQAMSPYPLDGVPQRVKVGVIHEFPVFFACGSADTCDLCSSRVVQQTSAMVASNFSSAINACGHKLIDPKKCPSEAERQKVIGGIIANIMAATASSDVAWRRVSSDRDGSGGGPYLVLDGDWEVGLDVFAGGCYQPPDSMPIAWYDRASRTVRAVAATPNGTFAWTGPTLDTLSHDCSAPVFNSTFSRAPSAFANRQWVQSVRVFPNGSAAALVHNEFHGELSGNYSLCSCQVLPHNNSCARDGHSCVYYSTGLAHSTDAGAHFELVAPPPHHLVAALPSQFVKDNRIVGYGAISPLLRGSDDALYGVINVAGSTTTLPPGQAPGNCPIRTENAFSPGAYRARDAQGGYTGTWHDPYDDNGADKRAGRHNEGAGTGLCATIAVNLTTPVSEHANFRQLVGGAAGDPRFVVMGTTTGAEWSARYAWSHEAAFEKTLADSWAAWTPPLDLPLVGVKRWVHPGGRVLYPVLMDGASPALGAASGSQALLEAGDNFLLVNASALTLDADSASTASSDLYVYFVASFRRILRCKVRLSSTPPTPPPPPPPPPPANCQAFVVSGAGDASFNGVYNRSATRTSDGVPTFEKDLSHTVYRVDGTWHMGHFAVNVVYQGYDNGTPLPCSIWGLFNVNSTIPAPASVTCAA